MPPERTTPPSSPSRRVIIGQVSKQSWKLALGITTRATAIQTAAEAADIPEPDKAMIIARLNSLTAEVIQCDIHCHDVEKNGKRTINVHFTITEK